MTTETGTPDTETAHSETLAWLNEGLVLLLPALLFLTGIVTFGFGAISWLGAIIWGAVAAAVMTGFLAVDRAIGMTTLNMLDLLGSMIGEPQTTRTRSLGFAIHAGIGALMGITGTYTLRLLGWAVTWLSGLVWGAFLAILALMALSSLGIVHPKIRDRRVADPGLGATHFGSMTPISVVMGHLIYGLLFGGLYQVWPLA